MVTCLARAPLQYSTVQYSMCKQKSNGGIGEKETGYANRPRARLLGDLLLVRLFLFLAYTMLLLNTVLGSPVWPHLINMKEADWPSNFPLDSLVWAVLSLYVHGSSLIALILDERAVVLSDDEAALWRMMYRTGGLSARLFQDIVARHLKVVEVQEGELIDTNEFFFIIYSGRVEIDVLEDDVHTHSRVLHSGGMFDLKTVGNATKHSIFENNSIRCKALSKAKLFQLRKDDLTKMSQNPQAKSVFQALLINNLMDVVEHYREISRRPQHSDSQYNKIFQKLEDWELPDPPLSGSGKVLQRPFRHLWDIAKGTFSLPWPFSTHPVGLRQTQLPAPPPREDEKRKVT
eukprot:scaffold333_cov133-Cylindrotheca_fusiformis.AAC.34